ncbi:RHS repeat-associated core domain-containing protein [Myxococcaceae bacterium GXIMD 01537]
MHSLTPRLLALCSLALLTSLAARADCPPAQARWEATTADGSNPDSPFLPASGFWTMTVPVPWSGSHPIGIPGEHGLILGGHSGVGGATGSFFPQGRGFTCTSDSNGCTQCPAGTLSYQLYSRYGNIVGEVTSLPDGAPWVGQVEADPQQLEGGGMPRMATNSAGHFDFSEDPDWNSHGNRWGNLRVFGDGTGPGSARYKVHAMLCDGTEGRCYWSLAASEPVTIYSNQDSHVRIEIPPNYWQDPSIRSCSVGQPVSVATGNVWFDQQDAELAGLPGITFTRSYNSMLQPFSGEEDTALGPGWSHPFQRRILDFETTPNGLPQILMLRGQDGVPTYFQDRDGDLRFEGASPFTREQWIQLARDSYGRWTYTLHFRKGGYEVYNHPDGRLQSIVDSAGNTTRLTYDVYGAPVTITDGSGRKLTLNYDSNQRLTTLSGPMGLLATYGYDDGRLTSVRYPDGSGYTFTYDAGNRLTTAADLSGRTLESHTYDAQGRALTSEIADGQERLTLSYQPGKTVVTDALGNATTYEYASIIGNKQLTRVTGPCTSCGGGGDETSAWTYDAKGRQTSFTNGAGKVTRYEYDPDTGDLLKEIDPLQQETAYTYDSKGRLLTRATPDGGLVTYAHAAAGPASRTEKVSETASRTTRFTYTRQGKLKSVTDPRGQSTTLTYNSWGDVASMTSPAVPASAPLRVSFGYDRMGRRTTVTDALGNITRTTYDAAGRIRRVTAPDGALTEFTYDAGGRRLTATDPMGRTTSYAYDPYGRLVTVTDPMNGVTRYGYDAMSNLVTLTDPRGKQTSFDYDEHNRVEKVTAPGETASESFTYDGAGRLRTRTDRRGITTTFEYDDLGRLTRRTSSDGSPADAYDYDPAGRLRSATNATDRLSWTYDLVGQPLTETSDKNRTTLEYTYDPAGNRISVSLNGTLLLGYSYDTASRLKALHRGSDTFQLGYDAASRRTSLQYPNGVTTDYAYDALSRLSSVTTQRAGSIISQSTYTHDAAGNRVTQTTPDFTETYAYDPLYRLTEVTRNGSPSESYRYDAAGNRTSSLTRAGWNYGDRNELISHSGASFTYDRNGNLETKTEGPDVWKYTWTADNQLARVMKNGTEVARFSYDALDRRVEKTAGAVTTTYTHSDEDILRERVTRGTGSTTNSHADGLGSIVKTTDATGAIASSRQYDAFGNLQAGFDTSGHAFTAREWDAETGLYYHRARYYDPKLGRFISEDPKGFRADINFYRYTHDNPVNETDPMGLDVKVCYRQAEDLPPGVPHSVIFPTKRKQKVGPGTGPCMASGFGPGKGIGFIAAGAIHDEPICDEYGNYSPAFACALVSESDCVEACVEREIAATRKDPPPYLSLPKSVGGRVCTDWSDKVIKDCQGECVGKE